MGTRVQFTIFYGYPAELVATWCGVSRKTAIAWKAGKRRPSRAAQRLFVLHRDGRVLEPRWKGWTLKPDSIVDPDGNETSRTLLHNYFWIVQFARRLTADREDPSLTAEFERLLRVG